MPGAQNGLKMKLVRLCWGCQGDLDPAGEPALCSCWAGQVVNSQTSRISTVVFRFLRVWEHGRGGKLAKHKIYLKSRLNCVLLTRYFI